MQKKKTGTSGTKKNKAPQQSKLWGGRFSADMDGDTSAWAASISFDKRLYRADIEGSVAHAAMLAKQGIISADDALQIKSGLEEILFEIESGDFNFTDEDEDIHMNIESALTKKIGEAGKRLHTARSRNDQVATDEKIWLKEELMALAYEFTKLRALLVDIAEEHTETVMPGYTHLQHAQPVSLGFHLMAYYQMFTRDEKRIWDVYLSAGTMPLGSGALSGTPYDIDRGFTSDELGFAVPTANAMDAVSDRDHIIEFISAAAIAMMHLSRFCEELILWNTSEFGFVEMSDSYSTGSSIMPQKKNPDVAELIRGKTGRVYGDLMAILTAMKSLPLAYNKDMQEDKEPMFDAADTLMGCMKAFTGMLATTVFDADAMKASAKKGFMNATDAADYLAAKGMPFRKAHETIGKLVAYCIEENLSLEEVPMELLKKISPLFDEGFADAIDITACMKAKASPGGTAPERVKEMIAAAKGELGSTE
ncbi:MAG: argininosuccinate lyase [Clostridiales Family XIII bacterium]|jgi:argininosuccinate lyase|nr:argininosuccinate lyase [Clostridiales Family XIII bacterium]